MTDWREKYLNKVTCGDTRELLRTLPDESVDCIITSPPYWGLRDYGLSPLIWDTKEGCEHEWAVKQHIDKRGNDGTGLNGRDPYNGGENRLNYDSAFCRLCGAWRGSLGLEPTFQLYLDHLMQIMGECKRVLKKTGTMWVNIGDSYTSSTKGSGGYSEKQESMKGTHFTPIKVKCDTPAKSLVGIPERFAIRMTDELQLIRRNTIIWWKRNAMPSSAKDRFTVDFEPMYMFVKSGRYWFEQQKEAAVQNRWGGHTPIVLENSKDDSGQFAGLTRQRDMMPEHRNRRTVWDIPTKPFAAAHFATFPMDFVTIPILSGCPPKGTVLDPFAGSGTTVLAAVKNGRDGIGFDLNPEYTDMRFDHIQAETAKIPIPFKEYEKPEQTVLPI